ncbi:MAG: hypothetical protein ABEJ69_02045 [Candidatus Nanohaloarchaea archaeon]
MDGDRVAAFLSTVLHPLAVPAPAGIIILTLSGYSFPATLRWVSVIAAVVVLPLLVTVKYLERYRGLDTDRKAPRNKLYLLGLACVGISIFLLERFTGPAIMRQGMYMSVLAGFTGALVNRKTKISLHTGVMAGTAAVMYYVNPLAGVLAGVATVLVSWSRIHLDHHTLRQVALGFLVPVLAAVVVFSIP